MTDINLKYEPISGKTYSLFGEDDNTDVFYETSRNYVESILNDYEEPEQLLSELRYAAKSLKRYNILRQKLSGKFDFAEYEHFVKKYTNTLDEHLASLHLFKRYDSALKLKPFQYELYILEIFLTNKINLEKFRESEFRFALLPHCLHDLTKDCMSESDGFEAVCKRCSKACFNRHVSDLLKSYNIQPYIWRRTGLKGMFKKLFKDYSSVAILGIACIPELVNGLRRSAKLNVPAIGLPLNANRCIRWFGDFYPNSVSLAELEKLINNV
ncbi:MAG: DUF116 domain-containing protein [FCB group bacterium]